MVGMIEEVDVDPPRTVVKDVAELVGPGCQKSQRVTATQRKVADQEVRLRAGRPELGDLGHPVAGRRKVNDWPARVILQALRCKLGPSDAPTGPCHPVSPRSCALGG